MKPQPLNKSPYEGLSDEEKRRFQEEGKREFGRWLDAWRRRSRTRIEIEADQIEEEFRAHFWRQEEEIVFEEEYAPALNEARAKVRRRQFRANLYRWRKVFMARAAAKEQRTKQTWIRLMRRRPKPPKPMCTSVLRFRHAP